MRFLADYVMRGRMQAVVATALTALLSLFMPPLTYLSGAAVGLVTLRVGPRQGLGVVAGAIVAVAALSMLLTRNPLPGPAFAIVLWLPVWVLAANLRRTVRLDRSVQLAGLFGVMLVVGIHLVADNPAGWWRTELEQMFKSRLEGATTQTIEEMTTAIGLVAQWMTGLMGGLMGLMLMISLFIARWWQALLYNPGGFREEFHQLRLGRVFTAASLLAGVPLLFSSGEMVPLATDLLVVMTMLFMVQGLAVSHGLVASAGASRFWLVVIYVMLVLALPQTVLTLAVAGFTDNWFDFRKVFGAKPKQ